MNKNLFLSSLVVLLVTLSAATAQQVEAPRITSWSNSKTDDKKTVFKVKQGEKITFSVKADGAEKFQWLVDGKPRKGADAESFKWTVPNRNGMWRICVKTTNRFLERRAKKETEALKGWMNKAKGRRKKRFIQDMLDLSVYPRKARTEWIVATFSKTVNPGESIQAAIDNLPAEGGTIELAAGVHDVHDTIVIKRSNVTIHGTHASVVRSCDSTEDVFLVSPKDNPKSGDDWPKFLTLKNITFRNFKADSTYRTFARPRRTFIHAWQVSGFTVEDVLDDSYLSAIVRMNPSSGGGVTAKSYDVRIQNNSLKRKGVSMAWVERLYIDNNSITGKSDVNWPLYVDHGCYHVHVRNNRVINAARNAAILIDPGQYFELKDNYFEGNPGGIDMSQGPKDAIVAGNTIKGPGHFGVMIKPQSPQYNGIITNNRIYNCRVGVLSTNYKNSRGLGDVAVTNNVIYNCNSDGIKAQSTHTALDIRNNIIANCKGYGINHSYKGGKTSLSHNNVWNNAKGNYKGCSAGPGDISVDPLFADTTKMDYHLKSKTGRWDAKTKKWVKDTVHSPCIDAGDPKADCSKEPAPNGGRVNMGAYGNTGEASKSTSQKKGHTGEIMSKKKQTNPQTQALAKQLEEHLEKNILSFLLRYSPDKEFGGFVTQMDRQGKWYGRRVKRLVPQTRMVWTFASAHRAGLGGGKYLQAARDGFPFLLKNMWDEKEGGWYWSVTRQGKQGSTRKRVYGQAFGIYGSCEYYFASGDKEALRKAEKTFDLLDKHAYDKKNGGYFTGDFTRDWKRRGSTNRSAGTHLHLVESFVSLVRATGKEKYRKRLKELLDILVDKLFLPKYGCNVEVYTEDWKPILESNTSYVHDLEAAWLIIDAAKVLGLKDKKYLERARNLVDYSLKYAWDKKNGGFFQNGPAGKPATNTKKNYNAQGEGLVALATLYRETGDKKYFQKLKEHAKWCLEVQADSKYGEWFTMCTAAGKPTMDTKGGIWKAGYHHPRGCLYAAIILRGIKPAK